VYIKQAHASDFYVAYHLDSSLTLLHAQSLQRYRLEPESAMAPSLEHVLDLRIYRSKTDTLALNSTKGNAQRFISPLTGGYLKGSSFSADFVQGGSDWLHVDPATGTTYLDARLHFREQSTGDVFYIRFTGVMRLDASIEKVLQWSPEARSTRAAEHYSFVSPVIEVSAERHKWMEQTAFVGHGHYYVPGDGTQAVEFEIYRLVTG